MSKQIFIFAIFIICVMIMGCSDKGNPIQQTAEQYTVLAGHLNTALTKSGSPYRVIDDIIVDSSSTLTIEAGVCLYFEDSTKIVVQGGVSFVGNPTHQILLSSKNASWKGIQIVGTNVQSVIKYVIIENIDLTNPYDTVRNGAVEILSANVVIANSIFRNNRSNNGGAIFIDQSQSSITNCLFIHNYAISYGGALVSSASSNKIFNNTFYKNESWNYAGGIFLYTPVLDSVQNNIFYQNTSTTGDPRIDALPDDSSHYKANYNFLGTSNPYFVSIDDFHLSPSSPCVNNGNPDSQQNDYDGTRNDQGAYGGPFGNW